MSHPPSPPRPWFGGIDFCSASFPFLPAPRLSGHKVTPGRVRDGLWRSVSQQNRPRRLRARHRDALSETFRCSASSLWPEADTHSPSSAARSRLWGSLGPVSPPEKRFEPCSWLLFPFPLQPALNSRSISFVFHPGSALCPSLHRPRGDIAVPDRMGWWQGRVLAPHGEIEAGKDFGSGSGLP